MTLSKTTIINHNSLGTRKNKATLLFYIGTTFFVELCFILFYLQTVKPDKLYPSDITAHMNFAETLFSDPKVSYPMFHLLYKGLSSIPFISGQFAAPFILSMCVLASIIVTRFIISNYIGDNAKPIVIDSLALALNVLCAIYIPAFSKYYYIGSSSPNIYHNPTYLIMKPFALVTAYLFFKAYDSWSEGRKYGNELMSFAISSLLTVVAKPSFALPYICSLILFLLIELFLTNFKVLKFALLTGLSLVPTVVTMFLQSVVMFKGESQLSIQPGATWKLYTSSVLFSVLQMLAFPLFVAILNRKVIFKDKKLFHSLIFVLVAGLQMYLFAETGARATDANFFWGYAISIAWIFTYSVALFIKNPPKRALWKNTGFVILSLHVISGIFYFIRLMIGKSYF